MRPRPPAGATPAGKCRSNTAAPVARHAPPRTAKDRAVARSAWPGRRPGISLPRVHGDLREALELAQVEHVHDVLVARHLIAVDADPAAGVAGRFLPEAVVQFLHRHTVAVDVQLAAL